MSKSLTVGFMLIATGKYHEFVRPFIESCEKHFLPGILKNYFVFTDYSGKSPFFIPAGGFAGGLLTCFHIEHLPFPLPTLLRFHRFLQQENELSRCDYLAYSDIDNLWVNEVSPNEVLSPLSATQHCGFIGGGTDFEQNCRSSAFFDSNGTQNACYYAGGFILATPQEYFTMARWCAERINDDFSKNIIAKWHDESFLNKYLNTIRNPQKVLTPSFHFAEYLMKNEDFKQKYPPKLLLLDKDHDEIRRIKYE